MEGRDGDRAHRGGRRVHCNSGKLVNLPGASGVYILGYDIADGGMNVKRAIAVIVVIVLVAALAGVYLWIRGADKRFAREVLDAMYAGSFASVKDSLAPEAKRVLDNPMMAAGLSGLSKQMTDKYGTTKGLKFVSEEEIPEATKSVGRKVVKQTWLVTCDKGTYDYFLILDDKDKLLGMSPGEVKPK